MSCPAARAPFHCPSEAETRDQLLALLPRGRAWTNDDGGPRPDTTIWKWFAALAAVIAFANARLCALREEFWCATHVETDDLWMAEYGLPDACDPFQDLCVKVAAIGGTRCDYYAAIAARLGWSVTCIERRDQTCGGFRGGRRVMGCYRTGRRLGAAQVIIRVVLADSPAYVAGRYVPPKMGRLKMGRGFRCPVDITPLKCLMARIVHAENKTIYEVI